MQEQEGLPHNIKSECLYYIKHLTDFTLRQVLSFCSEDNKLQFTGSHRRLITRYIKNVKRCPTAYEGELHRVSSTEAPVFAAAHRQLRKGFPKCFTTIMYSPDSSSSPPIDSPSSSSDGESRARGRSARRSSGKDAAALSVRFAGLSVAPHAGKPAAVTIINKAKALV
jgi:hypothetical protein